MYAQGAPLALCQDVKIATRLGCLHRSEGIFLSWYRQINGIIAGDLQKDAGVGAAFVGLSGGVQEARTKTQAGGNAFAVAYGMADGLQAVFMLAIHVYVGQQPQIVTCAKLIEMGT